MQVPGNLGRNLSIHKYSALLLTTLFILMGSSYLTKFFRVDSSTAIIIKQVECVLQLFDLLIGQVVYRLGPHVTHVCTRTPYLLVFVQLYR